MILSISHQAKVEKIGYLRFYSTQPGIQIFFEKKCEAKAKRICFSSMRKNAKRTLFKQMRKKCENPIKNAKILRKFLMKL